MPRPCHAVALVTAFVTSVALSSALAEVVVKKPGAASPKTDLGDKELQKSYDVMWEVYGKATADTTDTLTQALSGLQKTAQEDGNLDLALLWSRMLKSFIENGQTKWDNGAEAKKAWKEQFAKTPYPSTPFPDEITNTLEQCNKDYRGAKEALGKSYEELVKAITMMGHLGQATALREEKEKVLAEESVPVSPKEDQPKPTSWSEGIRDALCGTKWLHKNQYRYTFRRDGTYVLEGTPRSGKYAIVDDEKVVLLRWNREPRIDVVSVADNPDQWWMEGGPFRATEQLIRPNDDRRPPKQAVAFGTHHYLFIAGKFSWQDAKRKCEEMGGHLVTIGSTEENAFVYRLSQGKPCWIGLFYDGATSTRLWVTREPNVFQKWRRSQPEGSGDPYASIGWSGTDEWDDFNADAGGHQNFVCEWEE